jgi:hypothetical protein
MQIKNDKWKIAQSISRIEHNREYKYKRGVIVTKYGYVSVYYEYGNQVQLDLSFMTGDVEYRRSFYDKEFSDRSISIMAGKFAKEKSNEN